MPSEKDHRSASYTALKEPTDAQYQAEKQRILGEHGREAMLAFAKKEQLHDYLAETGELEARDVLSAKEIAEITGKRESKWEQVAGDLVARSGKHAPEHDHEPER